jgi:hypothetical protein
MKRYLNARAWTLAAALAAAATLVASPAGADVRWSGAGYYLSKSATGVDVELVSGPYASEAACKADLAAVPQSLQPYTSCDYEASDPCATLVCN